MDATQLRRILTDIFKLLVVFDHQSKAETFTNISKHLELQMIEAICGCVT